jgi:hypothetical protein
MSDRRRNSGTRVAVALMAPVILMVIASGCGNTTEAAQALKLSSTWRSVAASAAASGGLVTISGAGDV